VLKLVLNSIESSKGPVHVAELSQRLGIEKSALEGMIEYWVRKGRLYDSDAEICAPNPGHCSSSCTGATNCAFVAKMPKSYVVKDRGTGTGGQGLRG
jgi:hypothetical protein